MPYSIRTADDIIVDNIPDDVPHDAPQLKNRVVQAREQRRLSEGGAPVQVGAAGEEQAAQQIGAEAPAATKFASGLSTGIQRLVHAVEPVAPALKLASKALGADDEEEARRVAEQTTKGAGWRGKAGELGADIVATAIPGARVYGATEATAARMLPRALQFAARPAAAITTGATTGAAVTPGDIGERAKAGAIGGAAGLAGELGGRALAAGIGALPAAMRSLRGMTPEGQELASEGLDMPFWQTGRGLWKTLAERARKLPLTGGVIKRAEAENFAELNREMVRRATPPKPITDEAGNVLRWEKQDIGDIGQEGVRKLSDAYDNAYGTIYKGRSIPIDDKFNAELELLARQTKSNFPHVEDRVRGAMNEMQDLLRPTKPTTEAQAGGLIVDASGKPIIAPETREIPGHIGPTADAVKTALGKLNDRITSAYNAGDGDTAEVLKGLRESLVSLRERGLPPQVQASLADVNKGYRSYLTYLDAMKAPAAQKAGMASPDQLLSAAQRRTTGLSTKAAGTGENVEFLTKAARALGSELPRVGPGTADVGTMLAMMSPLGKVLIPVDMAASALLSQPARRALSIAGRHAGRYQEALAEQLRRALASGIPQTAAGAAVAK